MKLTNHHVQVAQGALFLIDNIGTPPPNTDFRHFTNNAIAEHLQRHSYFYQQRNQPGPENCIPVNSDWMRKYFKNLLAKTGSSFYRAESGRDDSADKFFRKGTTIGFPADVLARYEYDRATFSEADLPGYIGDVDVADDDEDTVEVHGSTGNINNNTEPRPRKLSTARSGNQGLLIDQPTEAARVSSPSWSSQKSFRTTGGAESKEDEDDEEGYTYSDANENFLDQPELHTHGRTPAEPGAQDNSPIVQEETSEVEKLPLKVQSPEKRSGGLPKKQAPHPAKTPMATTRSIPFPPPLVAQGSHASYPPSRAKNAIESALSRAKKRNGSGPEHDGLEQPTIRSAADIGKRKRSDKDVGDSFEDEVAIESTERKRSKTSIKLGRNVVHPQVVIPGATSPPRASSELTFAASTPLVANATHNPEDPNGKQPKVEEVKDSQPSPRAAPTEDTEQQPKLAPFDAGEQGRDFENFYIMIERATDRVIKSIGDIGNSVSFLDESPSERLQGLYTRCWGSDWRAVRVRLTKEQVFTTPDAAMSMISAFLFDNVLNQQASIQEIHAKQLELKGTMGRAILKTLALKGREEELAKVARTIESEDARIKLIEGEKSGTLQHELYAEAEQFTKQLWDILVPHFRSLSRLARGYGLSSNRPERDWRDVFETVFTKLIEEILHFRLKLLATGCEHVYMWPDAAQEYDLREMDFHGAQMKLPVQVMFTVFPGVKVKPHGSANMRAYKGMKAMTKVEMPRAV